MSHIIAEMQSLIWRAGPTGITGRGLARRSAAVRRIGAKKRDALLDAMVADRLCVPLKTARTTTYVDRDFIAPERQA